MKLVTRISILISAAIFVLFAVWAVSFYYIIIDEINDETDDFLEDYSEQIITRKLAGEELPSTDNGTNNSYYISEVNAAYAIQHPAIQYSDTMVYIQSKKETEPARVLKTIFQDADTTYYELIVAIPTIEKEDLKETIFDWLVFLFIVLVVAVFCVNWFILRHSFKPFYRLLNWLDHFTVGKHFKPLENETTVTEFRKLNDVVMNSARRNIEIYEQQKLFIGHASHEYQTPLAICQNRLEMLADDPNLTEKQLGEIYKTQETLNSLVKLNKTLLLFTKIENGQFPEQKEIVINDLITSQLEGYQEIYETKHISATVNESGRLCIVMNDMLASILINNLLKNAFVHNITDGTIEINISPSTLKICNTGEDKALDPSRLFKRFYQGSKKEGSTGLGLALTDSICKLYGISVSYNYYPDARHCFILKL